MRRWFVPFMAVVIGLAPVGCGGGGSGPDPEADQQRAEEAILTADDLPPSFEEVEPDAEEESASDECLGESRLDDEDYDEARTAEAATEFEGDEAVNVGASVDVFDNDDFPSQAVELIADDEVVECLVDFVQAETGDTADAQVSAAGVGDDPEIDGSPGDGRASARLELTLDVSGQEVAFVVDVYVVRVKRALVTLTVSRLAQSDFDDQANDALTAMVNRL